MRFGLIGTGYWAGVCHAPGLAASPDVEFAGVWGRSGDAAAALADRFGVRAYPSVEALLDDVDAVSFAVPPAVQAPLALRAIRAGRHVLLEKPPARTVQEAQELQGAAAESGVAALVFLTNLFQPEVASWVERVAGSRWAGAEAAWVCAPLSDPGSPYYSSEWRWSAGALWDVGPHALSILLPALGPVEAVTALGGEGDLVSALLRHQSGAVSTLAMTLRASREAERIGLELWGESGRERKPNGTTRADAALATAAATVAGIARGERPGHPAELRLGVEIVRILAELEELVRRAGDKRMPRPGDNFRG